MAQLHAIFLKSFVLLMLGFAGTVFTGRNIMFDIDSHVYNVLKGTTAHLICEQNTEGKLFINHDGRAIVENSVFVGSPSKYIYSTNGLGNTYNVTITEVSEEDSGIYFCRKGYLIVKQLNLEVYYSPSSGPKCVSSYGPSTYFFDDQDQLNFEFNCSVENGNPPVEVTLFKDSQTRQRLNTTEQVGPVTNERQLEMTFSFKAHLDASFHGTSFICSVTQDMPENLKVDNYNEECLYGPMVLLPSFNITVNTQNVTIYEGENKTLTCGSNVSSVAKRWTGIPKRMKFKTEEDTNNLILTIVDITGLENRSVSVICEVSLGKRILFAEATIYKGQDKKSAPNEIRVGLIVFLVILGVLLLSLLVTLLLFRNSNCSNRLTVGTKRYHPPASTEHNLES